MNRWKRIDKQTMGLTNIWNNDEEKDHLIDLLNHPRQGGGGSAMTEEMLPNYDFQPNCLYASSQHSNVDSINAAGIPAKSPVDSKANSGTRDYGFTNTIGSGKFNTKNDWDVYKTTLTMEIDRTVKKHTENLVNVLEGVSARLSQLENKSRQLENSVDDLKASSANNHGSTDGKLSQIENIIREVQAGVHVVKDKHEILEAQLQLSKVHEPPLSRLGSGFSDQYVSSRGHGEPYPYGGGPPVKSQGLSSSNMNVPHGGSRVPVDDVVDKVNSMGFPRDLVRATVRKLTENGKAVDLNAVLDKLTTDGTEVDFPCVH
ncbi:hypothetical protein L1887_10195 [Cichorium endivia]|nr:hypothetical protein L1887_10195 [Cichorium endivia]